MKIYFLLRFVDLLLFVGVIFRYSDSYETIFLTSLIVHGTVAVVDSIFLLKRKCDDSTHLGGCFCAWFVVTTADAITYFYLVDRIDDVFSPTFAIGLFVTAICTTCLRMPKTSFASPPPPLEEEEDILP